MDNLNSAGIYEAEKPIGKEAIEEYVDCKLLTAMEAFIEDTYANPESTLESFNIDEDKYDKFRPKLEEAYSKLEDPTNDKYTKSLAMGIYEKGFRVGILSVLIAYTMRMTNNFNLREVMTLFKVREDEIDDFEESVNKYIKDKAKGCIFYKTP